MDAYIIFEGAEYGEDTLRVKNAGMCGSTPVAHSDIEAAVEALDWVHTTIGYSGQARAVCLFPTEE